MKTVITLLIFAACLNANAQICFNPAANFAVGSLPTSVANADFNCDGIEDLVVGNTGSNNVSVLSGTGSGNFDAAVNYTVGATPMAVGVGDFNKDGKIDLAVCNWSSNTVSVLLGTGTGTFGAAADYAVGAESCSVVIEDFNRDGNADLAVSNRGSYTVSILLGTGTGSFGSANDFAVGTQPRHLSKADFNGDGIIDLVTANYGENTISVILGTGTGSFGNATNFVAGSSPHSVSCGDYNRDGKVDLAVANIYSNDVSIIIGDGTGNFGAATNYAVGVNPESIITTDVNGDGMIDLAVANTNSNNVSVLLGAGTGSFDAAINFAVGIQPSYLICADLNNDGKDDLVSENYGSNNISVLLNCTVICTGNYGTANNFASGDNLSCLTSADFNRDGKSDLAGTNYYTNSVNVLLGTGTGNFGTATSFTTGDGPQGIQSADFNMDGIADLVVTNYYLNTVSVFLGTGTGSFGAANSFGVSAMPTKIAIADFNGDGKVDLAVAHDGFTSDVGILLGTGTGSFGTTSYFAGGSDSHSIISADFNGDGKADLAVTKRYSSCVSVLLGTGSGSFGPAACFATGNYPISVSSGDFNSDGKIDLAVANIGSSDVSVLLGSGTGSFSATTNYAAGPSPYSVTSGDFNRDGKVDLAVSNDGSASNIWVLLGTGTGNFGAATTFTVGANPRFIINGDFNRDGSTDLATANFSTGISLLLNSVLPNLSAGIDQEICAGSSVVLSGSGATTYSWSNGADDGIPFTPIINTTYTVTGTDGTGCTNTDTVIVTIISTPVNLSITNGLVAYYPFNGNANDESGNGINGTVNNAALTNDEFGNPNMAYDFNGSSSYIDLGDEDLLNPHYGSITVSAWAKKDVLNQHSRIYSKGTHGGSQPGYDLMFYGAGISKAAGIFSAGGHEHIVYSNNPIDDLLWHHYTVVINRQGYINFYLDGIKQNDSLDISDHQLVDLGTNTYNANIGASYSNFGNPGPVCEYFYGAVDEVRVYNRGLSESEVYALYLPVNVNVVSDTLCQDNSTNINLLNSENGISYQLINDGVNTGSPQIGNGGTLIFNTGDLNTISFFTFEATNTASNCEILLDTIITIHINPVYAITLYDTICDGETYNWQGNDYTTANTYISGFSTINGCDSIYTLNLTVNPVYTFTLYDTVCYGETYNWQGADYSTAGNYTANYLSVNACDSVYNMNLIVNPAYAFNENHSICYGETYSWHGTYYTTAGNYTANYLSVNACDSVYNLNLIVNPAYAFNENHSICYGETYSWHGTYYTTAGNYTANYLSVNACDSVYSLNLTVNSVDVSLIVNDPIITANAIGAIYQWLDCDNGFLPISGASLQSYNATVNGNYAVLIVQGACSDTSVCEQITNVGLNSFPIESIVIYPNPVSNELIIEMKGNHVKIDFEILNSIGQIVFIGNLVEKTTVQTSNLASGVYFVKLKNLSVGQAGGKTFEFKKIIKE